MDYLNYLQQYREKYHLDDIFILNDNVEEEQVKKYIEKLFGIPFFQDRRVVKIPSTMVFYEN